MLFHDYSTSVEALRVIIPKFKAENKIFNFAVWAGLIPTKISKVVFALMFAAVVLSADVSWAQPRPTPPKRLRSPAVVRGFIGGESHDAYVIRATEGQIMTVQLSWRREGDNRAEFEVSDMPGFFNIELVTFGKTSNDGKRWTGKIPKTANYYVYVVAHPHAHYTLRVTLT